MFGDNGPPVLLLHGGGQTRHAWRKTAEELARETCKGQPVLPPCLVKLRLTLAREGAAETRELELLFVELDAARDLPSRAHRNELARVLGSIALSCGRDVVIIGALIFTVLLPRPWFSSWRGSR